MIHNMAVAIAYFLTGEVGLLLAIPPGYATAIWPPSGIALAAVLILGYRIWPGILLGSFLVNIQTTCGISSPTATLISIIIPVLIGSGAALQAVVSAFLLRRYAAFPNSLASAKEILSFLLLGGLAGSLVNSTIGVSALLAFGRISASDLLANWMTWWVGDTMGVFIFTPLALAWRLNPREVWLERRKTITFSVVITFTLTTLVVALGAKWERKRLEAEFDQHASALAWNLKQTLEGRMGVLKALQSFHNASTDISRDEFRNFTKPYLEEFGSIQALSWNPRIPSSARESFEAKLHKEGFPSSQISERTADGRLVRAADRSEYVAVYYIEPVQKNLTALGYDVYSQWTRHEAIDQARDIGKPVVTGGIKLVQETGQQFGVLVFMPVYRNDMPYDTVEERRRSILGYMVGVLRVGDVLEAVLAKTSEEGIVYKLIDDPSTDEHLLYESKHLSSDDKLIFKEKGVFGGEYSLRRDEPISFGNRQWRLEVLGEQQFIVLHRSENTWLILVAGLVLTSLVGVLALLITGRSGLLRRMVAESTAALKESESKLLEAQQISCMGNWEWDVINRKIWWSDEIYRIFGMASQSQELTYEMFLDRVHPDDRAIVVQNVDDALYNRKAYDIDHRIVLPDGQVKVVHERAQVWFNKAEEPARMFGTVQDITARKEAEAKLHLAASVFAHANEAILITDPTGIILDVNAAFSRLTGYSRKEVLGQNPRLLSSGKQNKAFYADMWQKLINEGQWSGEIWNRRKNGEYYAELLTISTVKDSNNRLLQYVAMFSDITSIKEHQSFLEHIVHFDALTGLPNRTLLADRINQAMIQSSRRNETFALAYLDLDGFKAVNDSYGHDVGDRLLVSVANRMKQTLREGDTLARLGGDEFVAVLLNLPDFDACQPLLNRLLAAAAEPIYDSNAILQVSTSVGVSFYPQSEPIDADQLMRQADQAMYLAKQEGKNRYHLFDTEHDRNLRDRHENLAQIELALAKREFVLYYQPKVNMSSGEVIGAEALIRWQHPQLGLQPPAMFLPIAEGHPLMIEIGDWVIETALVQIADWKTKGIDLSVSVNVAAQQLTQPNL